MSIARHLLAPAAAAVPLLVVAAPARAQSFAGLDWRGVWAQMQNTGTTGIFLGLLSIVGLAFVLERLLHLRRTRIAPKGFADDVVKRWHARDFEGITQRCDRDGSILAHAVATLVEFRNAPREAVVTAAGDVAALDLRPHYRRLQPLAVVAVLAPLLGLFGTVIGMIQAFAQFELLGETGNPSVFAGSISLALVTTALGLVIAMPALAAFHYFKNRTNAHADLLEEQLQEINLRCLIAGGAAGPAAEGREVATTAVADATPVTAPS